ncbi:phosphoglucosamine mutase [Chloroflexota bacterium]
MNNSTQINFGTDGIRGIAGEWPINLEGARKIGAGLGAYLRSQKSDGVKVLIGQDTRLSGDMLVSSLASGLLSQGIDVHLAGVLPTSGVAFMTKSNGFDSGIVISASHNPWPQNGIKLISSDGSKLTDQQQEQIVSFINAPDQFVENPSGFGKMYFRDDLVDQYIDFLIKPFKSNKTLSNLHVIIDCANGAASGIAEKAMQKLGIKTHTIHNQPDGRNINVESGSEVIRDGHGDLYQLLIQEKADIGVAYDGDADRAIFLDENANLVDGDHVLYILAKYLKQANALSNDTLVTTEMANSGLEQALSKIDVTAIRTKVGDRYVFEKMMAEDYVLGGEQSGHIIIYDQDHNTGDGIYTSLYLFHALTQLGGVSLSQIALELKKNPQVISSSAVKNKTALESITEFQDALHKLQQELGAEATINARYSGTEPLFRLMIESTLDHTPEQLARVAVKISRIVQSANQNPEGWIEVKDCTSGKTLEINAL